MHVASWAKRFLFRPEQLEVPVGRLSGGEQARILIARLMREPADVLILDEPTNDLDIPTLEVLEDSLAEFAGALVLVTHDRFMLERVSTVILALDGRGGTETFADYAQWEAGRSAGEAPPRKTTGRAPERERARPKRLGYVEQREWDGMEQAILEAERAVESCRGAADDPAIASDPTALQTRYAALVAAQAEVESALRALGGARGQAGLTPARLLQAGQRDVEGARPAVTALPLDEDRALILALDESAAVVVPRRDEHVHGAPHPEEPGRRDGQRAREHLLDDRAPEPQRVEPGVEHAHEVVLGIAERLARHGARVHQRRSRIPGSRSAAGCAAPPRGRAA